MRWSMSALTLLAAAFFLFPFVIMLLTSLKPSSELFSVPVQVLPTDWTWSNYLTVWEVVPLAHLLRSSIVIAVAATAVVMMVAIPAAYCTARMRFRGRGVYLGVVLATQMLVPGALIVGIYREVLVAGLMDSIAGLVIVNAAFNLAFAVWILNSYFQSLPYEIEEAAMIDGCSRFATIRKIVIPLALPGIVTASIFTFIAAWNEYIVALTLISSPDKLPITVGIASLMGRRVVDWQHLFASSLIAILPVVVLFLVIEQRLVSGLAAGGVKQ